MNKKLILLISIVLSIKASAYSAKLKLKAKGQEWEIIDIKYGQVNESKKLNWKIKSSLQLGRLGRHIVIDILNEKGEMFFSFGSSCSNDPRVRRKIEGSPINPKPLKFKIYNNSSDDDNGGKNNVSNVVDGEFDCYSK